MNSINQFAKNNRLSELINRPIRNFSIRKWLISKLRPPAEKKPAKLLESPKITEKEVLVTTAVTTNNEEVHAEEVNDADLFPSFGDQIACNNDVPQSKRNPVKLSRQMSATYAQAYSNFAKNRFVMKTCMMAFQNPSFNLTYHAASDAVAIDRQTASSSAWLSKQYRKGIHTNTKAMLAKLKRMAPSTPKENLECIEIAENAALNKYMHEMKQLRVLNYSIKKENAKNKSKVVIADVQDMQHKSYSTYQMDTHLFKAKPTKFKLPQLMNVCRTPKSTKDNEEPLYYYDIGDIECSIPKMPTNSALEICVYGGKKKTAPLLWHTAKVNKRFR